MNLKEFSPETIHVDTSRNKPVNSTICISHFGRIAFNTLMCEKLALKVGDPVKFWQDGDVWYVSKTKGGFALRKENKTKSLSIQTAPVAKAIVASVNASAKSVKAKIYPEPEMFGKEKLYRLDFVPVI